jgi:hypothetical protein
MKPTVRSGDLGIDLDDDVLILTINVDDLVVCTKCENLHVMLVGSGAAARLRLIAGAFLHMAVHADERERNRS